MESKSLTKYGFGNALLSGLFAGVLSLVGVYYSTQIAADRERERLLQERTLHQNEMLLVSIPKLLSNEPDLRKEGLVEMFLLFPPKEARSRLASMMIFLTVEERQELEELIAMASDTSAEHVTHPATTQTAAPRDQTPSAQALIEQKPYAIMAGSFENENRARERAEAAKILGYGVAVYRIGGALPFALMIGRFETYEKAREATAGVRASVDSSALPVDLRRHCIDPKEVEGYMECNNTN